MFFKYAGTINYPFGFTEEQVSDITKSLNINNLNMIIQHVTIDAESPEQLSFKLYGDPNLFWTILLTNNIVDPFLEWVMTDTQLEQYCNRIYKEKINRPHHFFNLITKENIFGEEAKKFEQMIDDELTLPEHIDVITNFMYEKELNIHKQVVKVIPQRYISQFVDSYKEAMR